MMEDHLRFAPDILRRLGEELNPNPDQGLLELIRNAYDADAINCKVELLNVQSEGGTIIIEDDGVGMTIEDLRDGWLVLGRSRKNHRAETPKFHRLKIGEKGLGRLAALRMGSHASVVTVPEQTPRLPSNLSYRLDLDWDRFDAADTVEGVPLIIETEETQSSSGTRIVISNLRHTFSRRDVQRLARSILLLVDPFQGKTGFHLSLICSEFPDVESRFERSYFDDAATHLVAELRLDGSIEAFFLGRNGVEIGRTRGGKGFKQCYKAPAAKFELWEFPRSTQFYVDRQVSLKEIGEWLNEFGGVFLYHHGLRVHPYGDAGHDWIQMNLARTRNPELRPSTQTSTGYIDVLDPLDLLVPKTDRSGFIENEAFRDLKEFATDVLEWMGKVRVGLREEQRQKDRESTPKVVTAARTAVNEAVEHLPAEDRPLLKEAIGNLERAREQEIKVLNDELLIYRTLATVGTTAAVFAHESARAMTRLQKAEKSIELLASPQASLTYQEDLKKIARIVGRAGRALQGFGGLLITLLKKEKRNKGPIHVNSVIADVYVRFSPFLEEAGITILLDIATGTDPVVQGSEAALEAIIANLITNAHHAVTLAYPRPINPTIILRTQVAAPFITLRVLDNGPGITELPIDEIWLPGHTSKTQGTGLGLTIVRDSAIDLGGQVSVLQNGELGGAEFVVKLPLRGIHK